MANLPVLTSLTELLTGTVTDEFKKLIQPASLVTAAAFLALNLVLVLPPLVAYRVAPAVAVESLPTIWQIVLGTLILFTLGYIINSLGGFFLSLLSGNAFRNSPVVYAWLRDRQVETFKDAREEIDAGPQTGGAQRDEQARAAAQLAYDFPQEEKEVGPTSMGNVLLNTASYTWHQYGVHLDTIWPTLDLVLKEESEELRNRLRDNRDGLTFLSSLTVLQAVVAIELVIVGSVLQQPLHAILGAPVMLLAAYVVYQAAVQKARAWGRDVRTAFDLHLDPVAERLGLRDLPPQDFDARKTRWEEVSRWLAYGVVAFDQKHWNQPSQKRSWYKAPAPHVLEVKHPPTVSVEYRCQSERRDTPDPEKPDTKWFLGQRIDYLFTVTNEESSWHTRRASGCFLSVADSRLPVLPEKVAGDLTGTDEIDGERRSGNPPALFWDLGDVSIWSSRILQYTIHEVVVEVSPMTFKIESVSAQKANNVVDISLRNNSEEDANVTVKVQLQTDDRLPSRAFYKFKNEESTPSGTEAIAAEQEKTEGSAPSKPKPIAAKQDKVIKRVIWKIDAVPSNASVILSFERIRGDLGV
jgi:hypothetical protein